VWHGPCLDSPLYVDLQLCTTDFLVTSLLSGSQVFEAGLFVRKWPWKLAKRQTRLHKGL